MAPVETAFETFFRRTKKTFIFHETLVKKEGNRMQKKECPAQNVH